MKKNIISILIVMALCFMVVTSFNVNSTNENIVKAYSETKDIDMYLIAGQSNAAGYSTFTDLTQAQKDTKFNNVMYAGQTDKYINGSSIGQDWLKFSDFKQYVTTGYGTNYLLMGPEYGMAKVLNEAYTNTDKAFIFKTAAGGTCLQDYIGSGGSMNYGNWYPRSLWAKGYEPDLNNKNSSGTGYLYKLFVENFKTVYNELKSNGYNPIVKGMVWMQGEEDLGIGCTGTGRDYDVLLKQFITDIRNDIYTITEDEKTIDMRFVIGKIATSFGYPNNTGVPTINALQQKVANEMDYVETIETSDLIITYYDGTTLKTKGSDIYHFCGLDDITLGERFATKLLSMEESTDGKIKLKCTNGTAEATLNLDNITISNITPESGYKLASVTINDTKYYSKGESGYPITNYEDNQMFLDISSLDNPIRYLINIYFEADIRLLKVINDSSKGRIVTNPNALKQIVGTTVTVTIQPFTGYEVASVKFNGAELTPNGNGKYEITYVDENELEVIYKKAGSNSEQNDTKNGGCSGTINSAVTIDFIIIAVAIMLLRKEGKRQ